MSNDTIKQAVLFKGLSQRTVSAQFDQDHASSDGGAVLLKACDEALGLSRRLAGCLVDGRQSGKVLHQYEELFQQRMFGIACGYADANDAARLSNDPVHKLLVGRDPIAGNALASQATLSRFENAAGRAELLRLSEALSEVVIQRHKRRKKDPRRITIDLDPTVDPTHGGQQQTFFNGYYDTWCYLPMAGFITFDAEVEQYLCCYVLRPGNASANAGCVAILKRLVAQLRRAFPKTTLRVRLDGGFSSPQLYDFFEAERLEYVVGIAKNSVLKAFAEPSMVSLREQLAAQDDDADKPDPTYSDCQYQAGKWPHPRRVIIKAEITCHPGRSSKENPRFVVTNLKQSPGWIYREIYCARGDAENRIKELKDGLEIDRTSCTSFLANQLRVLMTAAAYVLMQELRLRARHSGCSRAQVSTLRLRLLKIGAWVETSVRRIVLHLPTSMPYADDWRRIARAVGAIPS